jgi:GR25 family glycosyltransferase involved in LPS biosynthesis
MNLLENILYINLNHRTDRKTHVEQQLRAIGCHNFKRFPAIIHNNGAIGCSMSHLHCLKFAKKQNWDYVFIVEDDILFLQPHLFKLQIDRFIKQTPNFDVLLIAGNNFPPFIETNSTCIQVSHCQTTTGYIVSKHYYDTLIDNINTGINNFIHNPDKPSLFAIDQWWFQLQQKDKWFLLIPIQAIQRQDYSDVEKRNVNYKTVMTDYKKEKWFL